MQNKMKQNGKAKGDTNGFLKIYLFMWPWQVSAAARGISGPHGGTWHL